MNIDLLFRGSGLLLGMVGLWLIYWFLLADRAKGRKRCSKCWYDMPSADSLRCSECGNDAKCESDLLKTRRRWKGLWICLPVFLAAGYLWIQPKVKQDGWASVMPTTALILCLRLENNQAFFAELDRRTPTDVRHVKPYFYGTSYTVADPESLYQWQWRFIGNTCIELKTDEPIVLDRRILSEWLSRTSTSLPAEDAEHYFQAAISFLADDDPGIRARAAINCADARFSEEFVEAVRPLLDDPIQLVRSRAISGLGRLDQYSPTTVRVLIEILKHDNWEVRRTATFTLGSIAVNGEEPLELFETLVNIYNSDSEVVVRAIALRAICWFESQQERAYGYLREAFSSTENVLRGEAIWSFTCMRPIDEAFDIEFALKGLTDESLYVRRTAAGILENRISTDSLRPHEEFLRELADSDDMEVRRVVRQHLLRIQETIED